MFKVEEYAKEVISKKLTAYCLLLAWHNLQENVCSTFPQNISEPHSTIC
jgi:hypothetical protein